MSVKIAILDCSNSTYKQIFKLTSPGKISYCKRFGFDFLHFEFELKDRSQHWGRVLGIQKYLNFYDYIVYLDTDSLITNKDFDTRQLIEKNSDALLITGPKAYEGHIGTNGIIIKSCDWCREFLEDWYSKKEFIESPYYGTFSRGTGDDGGFCAAPEDWKFYEQSAFHFLYDSREDVRKNTTLLDRKFLHGVISTHKKEDFLIHFPGMSFDRKVKAIKHYLSRAIL